MNFKSLIQVILIILIIFICGIFYYKYFYDTQSSTNAKNLKISDKEDINEESLGNILKDVEYKSEDENGNSYLIKSKQGEFKDQDSNIVYMTNVTAILKFKDKTTVKLTSLNAKYHILDSNTNFYNKVNLDYLTHNVMADNIDIFFKDSKVEAYNNLVYRNSDLSLIADKIEIDLITKNSKIFMFDDKKVKVFKIN